MNIQSIDEQQDMRLLKFLSAVAIIESVQPERLELLMQIWRNTSFEELNQIHLTPEQIAQTGMSMEGIRARASDGIDRTVERVRVYLGKVRTVQQQLNTGGR